MLNHHLLLIHIVHHHSFYKLQVFPVEGNIEDFIIEMAH
jgi:hypothetical protein